MYEFSENILFGKVKIMQIPNQITLTHPNQDHDGHDNGFLPFY